MRRQRMISKIYQSIALVLLSFIAGCSVPTTASPTPTITKGPLPYTITPSPFVTVTTLPTETRLLAPSISATQTMRSSTPTVTLTMNSSTPSATHMISSSTPTSFQTLPPKEAEAQVVELIQHNGGCRLPCWWGLAPGKTSLQTTKSFLDVFGSLSIANRLGEKGGYFILRIPKNNLFLDMEINYPKRNNDMVEMLSIRMILMHQIKNGYEVVYGDPLYKQFFQPYLLSQILSTYGQPSDVWIYVDRLGKELHIWLSYAVSGFLVDYVAPSESEGGQFLGCPSKAYTELWLWPPEREYSPAEAISVQLGDDGLGQEWFASILPIKDATTLTVDAFYNIYKDSQNISCLETPVELWP
jgi:hypothetical protein